LGSLYFQQSGRKGIAKDGFHAKHSLPRGGHDKPCSAHVPFRFRLVGTRVPFSGKTPEISGTWQLKIGTRQIGTLKMQKRAIAGPFAGWEPHPSRTQKRIE